MGLHWVEDLIWGKAECCWVDQALIWQLNFCYCWNFFLDDAQGFLLLFWGLQNWKWSRPFGIISWNYFWLLYFYSQSLCWQNYIVELLLVGVLLVIMMVPCQYVFSSFGFRQHMIGLCVCANLVGICTRGNDALPISFLLLSHCKFILS